jgi:hypothetical protein
VALGLEDRPLPGKGPRSRWVPDFVDHHDCSHDNHDGAYDYDDRSHHNHDGAYDYDDRSHHNHDCLT